MHGLVIADHVPVELQLRVGLPDPDVLYPSAHEPVAVLLADVEVNTVPFTVAAAHVIAAVRGTKQPTVLRSHGTYAKNCLTFLRPGVPVHGLVIVVDHTPLSWQ